ncbi:hypothetical protein AC1031_009236 [Aphanomyces cochlioides]|nr:hypothetical protein AC1031_009236 [Aphanomyces cochlioides]
MAIVSCGAFATDLSISAFVVMALGQVISTSAAVLAIKFVVHALDWLLMGLISLFTRLTKKTEPSTFKSTISGDGNRNDDSTGCSSVLYPILLAALYFGLMRYTKASTAFFVADFYADSLTRWAIMIPAWRVICLMATLGDLVLKDLLSPAAKLIKVLSMPTWMMPLAKLERGNLSLYGAKIEVTYVRMTASGPNVYGVDIMVNRANTWSVTTTMTEVRSLRDCMACEVADGAILHTFQIDSTDDVQAFLDAITLKRTWSAVPSLRNFCRMH